MVFAQGARDRADSLSQSPSGNGSPRLQPLLSGSPGAGGSYTFPHSPGPGIPEEVSGDESGVMTRQPGRQRGIQYQAPTHTSSSPRRRSAVQSRRTSGQTLDHESDGPGDIDSAPTRQQTEKGWAKNLQYFHSIELENKGSVARDHLALGKQPECPLALVPLVSC